MSFFRHFFKGGRPAGTRKVLTLRSRRLQLESLENRELLSVSPNDPDVVPSVVEWVSTQTIHEDACCIELGEHATQAESQTGNADLTFYTIVSGGESAYLSLVKGSRVNIADVPKATSITTDDRVYLNFALLYTSDAAGATVSSSLANVYIDNVLVRSVSCGGLDVPSNGIYDPYAGAGIGLGGLTAGTHTIKVVLDANNDITETNEGNNEYSFSVTVTQFGTPVADPTGVVAETTGNGTVQVSWNTVSDATHYQVCRKNADGTWTILSDGSNATVFYDVNPSEGPQTYSVRAFRNAASSAAVEATVVVPPEFSKVPQLSSLPDATYTIYLDFDGHAVQNSRWNSSEGVDTIQIDVFDIDGDKTSFSDLEVELMEAVWAAVAEYYSSFNINVTTIDPGLDGLYRSSASDDEYGVRACIGGTNGWYAPGSSTMGVAYVGIFDEITFQDDPAMIFSESVLAFAVNNLATEKNRRLYVAGLTETIVHEVGHTFGLEHDGKNTAEYYSGHRIVASPTGVYWVPFMGSGYLSYNNFFQWSNGDYTGATNPSQDDLAIIAGNGPGFRTDTDGTIDFDSLALTAEATGIIETTDDSDAFTFTVDFQDDYTFSVTAGIQAFGWQFSSLYFKVDLVDAATGTTIATRTASVDTLSLSLTETLSAGTYTLIVTGIGLGGPSDGFSSYGSVGTYTINASRTTAEVPVPQNLEGLQVGDGRIGLHWDAVDGAAAYNIYRKDGNEYVLLETVTGTSCLITGVRNGTATYVVTAVTGKGNESKKTAEVAVTVDVFDLPGSSVSLKAVRNGFLIVNGTAGADDIEIRNVTGNETRFEVLSGETVIGTYEKSQVKLIALNGFGGDDVFVARNTDIAVAVDGGDGNDMIYGGAGCNFLDGGDGDNRIVGGTGTNLFYNAGSGSSLFVWQSEGDDFWAAGHSNNSAGRDDAQLLFYGTDRYGRTFFNAGLETLYYVPWSEIGILSVLNAVEYVYSVLGSFEFFRDNSIAEGASFYREGAVNICLLTVNQIPAAADTWLGTAWTLMPNLADTMETRATLVRQFAGFRANEAGGTMTKNDWVTTVEYVLARVADPENATDAWHENVAVVHQFLNTFIDGQNPFGQTAIVVDADSLAIDLSDGKTSLTEAILYARRDSTITFASSVTTVVLNGSALSIDKSLSIDGNGATIDAGHRGGVLEVRNGTVLLQNLTLTGADADHAVGVDRGAELTLLGVLLAGNTVTAGVIENQATTALINTVLFANTGYAIHQRNGMTTVSSSTFAENGKIVVGGGILVVNNSILARSTETDGNTLSVSGGAASVNASLMDVLVDPLGVTIADGSLIGTAGNTIDPKFTDPATGNLSLKADSPAFGAGNAALLSETITTDFSGNPRITDGMLHLGAFQSDPSKTLTAPRNFIAETVTSNSVTLQWTAVTGATGYRIQTTTDGTNWRTLEMTGSVTSLEITSLEPGTTYRFRIIAFNTTVVSPAAELGTPVTTLLPAPNDFHITGITKNTVSFAWTDSANEASYTLEYRKSTDHEWTALTLASDTVEYTVDGLDSSTEYEFRLRANAGAATGNSAYAPVLSAKTDDVYETNNSLFESTDLGIVDRPLTLGNLVMLDGDDYFRFELPFGGRAGSYVALDFDPAGGDLNLQLFDASGSLLASSTGIGNTARIDIDSLPTGIYYVRVYGEITNPEYALTFHVPVIPAVPDGVTLLSTTTTSASFAWNTAADATQYRLEYSTDETIWIAGATIDGVAGTTQTGSISNLSPATIYFFRLVALGDQTESTPSEVIQGTTKLGAPEQLSASETTATSVTLQWSKVDGANRYLVEYSADGTIWSTGTTVIASAALQQKGTVTGLDPGTTYRFRVTAWKNAIQSEPTILAATVRTPFEVRTDLSAVSQTSNSIALSWTKIPAATDYRLMYKLSSSDVWIEYPTTRTTTGGGTVALTVRSLDSGATYDFQLTALKDSLESNPETLTGISTRFQTPTRLRTLATSGDQATISWNAVSGDARYEISYSTDGETWRTVSEADVSRDGQTCTATISSLRDGTTYYFRVRALSDVVDATSEWSGRVTAVTKNAAPANFRSTEVTETSVSFTWSKSAGATAYRLEYGVDGTKWSVGAVLDNVPGGTIEGLLPETDYYFRVVAIHETESLPASIVVSTLPLDVPIVSVTNVGTDVISIAWTASTFATGYRIECIGPDGTQRIVDAATLSTTFEGLRDETEYEFRVMTLYTNGSAGVESVAGTAVASTERIPAILDMPNNLRAAETTQTTLTLVWDAVDGAVLYRLERLEGNDFQTVYTGNDLTYIDTDLEVETAYTYRVRALAGPDVSDYSAPLTATTKAERFGFTQSEWVDGAVSLQWSDFGSGTQYVLFKNGVPVLVTTNQNSYVDSNPLSTENSYVVYAYDQEASRWIFSSSIVVNGGPVQAEILSHEILPSGGVRLNWVDNGFSYVVFRDGVPVGAGLEDAIWTDTTAKDGENRYVLYVGYTDENGRFRWTWSGTYIVTKPVSVASLFENDALTALG